jgi:hypothetical protein
MKTQLRTLPNTLGLTNIFNPRSNTAIFSKFNDDEIDSKQELDYFQFAEKVNARSAMQGFVWGTMGTAITGKSINEQVIVGNSDIGYNVDPHAILGFVLVVGMVTLGTALTSIISPNNKYIDESAKYNLKGFTPKAEVTNGRLAMIGFTILLVSGLLQIN